MTPSHSSNPTKKKICSAQTASGTPCRAYARLANDTCIYHDPAYRQQLRQSGARGGHATRQKHHEDTLPFINLDTLESLQDITEGLLRMLLTGSIGSRQANAITRILTLAQRNL